MTAHPLALLVALSLNPKAGAASPAVADLSKVQLVIRDGEVVVENGRVFIPRHVPVPEPTPKPAR